MRNTEANNIQEGGARFKATVGLRQGDASAYSATGALISWKQTHSYRADWGIIIISTVFIFARKLFFSVAIRSYDHLSTTALACKGIKMLLQCRKKKTWLHKSALSYAVMA
jgi:hypothetical protein